MLPFKIEISDKQINEILKRVENFPWHEMPDDGGRLGPGDGLGALGDPRGPAVECSIEPGWD